VRKPCTEEGEVRKPYTEEGEVRRQPSIQQKKGKRGNPVQKREK
jgi:hypothetical protein